MRESLRSSNGEDGVGGRTSAEMGNVSDSPMGTSGGSDKKVRVENILSVSGVELISTGGALVSAASVA